ncbi:MAG TPA: hypothetical protein VMU19_10220 [Bryobacteraceae bacterium]|nr:hypothetical protein [Bryobacteraceae bacterium]
MLEDGEIALHPFVLGEIAAGNLKNRDRTLKALELPPPAPLAREAEVLHLLESHGLWERGPGWVDLHILASAAVAGLGLLTSDRALRGAARRIGLDSRS